MAAAWLGRDAALYSWLRCGRSRWALTRGLVAWHLRGTP